MKMKQWLIKKLLKWSKILDIEKALRDKYHEGCAATEKKYADKINVWWDPTMRSYPQSQKIVNPRGSYFKARHLEFMPAQPVIRTNTEPIDLDKDFPKWLTDAPIAVEHMTPAEIEKVPTIRDLTPDITEEMPAVVALLHQDRQQRRHAG